MKKLSYTLCGMFAAVCFLVQILTIPAFASDSLEQNIKNTQSFFSEKHSAPTWLFQQIKDKEGSVLTLSDDFYQVEFKSADIGPLDERLQRYDLSLVRLTEERDLKKANSAVGEHTPKYLLQISDGNHFPGKATFTLLDSHFRPNSVLHVYQVTEDGEFQFIQDSSVGLDGNVSFSVSQGGQYLVSARRVGEKLPMFDFERPSLTDLSQLITYTDEDTANEYLLGEITTWQEYFETYEEPYFPYDIEYDY